MRHTEIAIAGAGVIGLTLALELRQRGASVTVFDAGRAGIASTAAAGMLAVHDPENAPELKPLAELSASLYPALLQRIKTLSGEAVPLHTRATLQHTTKTMQHGERVKGDDLLSALTSNGFYLLQESSLDPKQLYKALKQAVIAAGVELLQDEVTQVEEDAAHVEVHSNSNTLQAEKFIDCMGAWSFASDIKMEAVKGQMLRVALKNAPLYSEEHGNIVIRGEEVYIVPRLDGSALIGATVEFGTGHETGIDKTAIKNLQEKAAEFLPVARDAEHLETWAGLRPKPSESDLPFIGPISERRFASVGHFRNGILLAPASAQVLADILQNKNPAIDITPFMLPALSR